MAKNGNADPWEILPWQFRCDSVECILVSEGHSFRYFGGETYGLGRGKNCLDEIGYALICTTYVQGNFNIYNFPTL